MGSTPSSLYNTNNYLRGTLKNRLLHLLFALCFVHQLCYQNHYQFLSFYSMKTFTNLFIFKRNYLPESYIVRPTN